MTVILGISALYHDSAAALIVDGEIKFAAQEERFSRIKHDYRFPNNAISSLIAENKLKLSEIDFVSFYDKPLLKFDRILETFISTTPKGLEVFRKAMPVWLREKLFLKNSIKNELKKFDENFKADKLFFSEHHFSHAASAFFPSPFEKAIVLTIDGVGEWATTTISIGNKNKLDIKKEINFPHSLGLLYSAFTYYLGFKVNSGEYKVMGLAPYGEPRFFNLILDNLISVKEDGSFFLNQKYFDYISGLKMTNNEFSSLFGRGVRSSEDDILDQFHMDVASSIQKVVEFIILKICKNVKKEYMIDNLCLAGGVALNCVANGKIYKENIFKNIWVQPASGDAGGAIGSALALYYQEFKNERKINPDDGMQGSYLGPLISNENIFHTLEEVGAKFKKLNDESLVHEVSNCLAEGKAVGWFQGRMEFGPRALGSRSILADPRSPKMQRNLNLKIKYRESFRPFAPAVIEEDVSYWFDFDKTSPYMLMTVNVNDRIKKNINSNEKKLRGLDKLKINRSSIPAITHVDYSARIQTVKMKTNPLFYKLLKKFKEKTECGVLINTSFNVRGEPIVCSVLDAFKCFMGCEMDVLAIGNFILYKKDQNKELAEDYKEIFELD